jgi:hypothetical protein
MAADASPEPIRATDPCWCNLQSHPTRPSHSDRWTGSDDHRRNRAWIYSLVPEHQIGPGLRAARRLASACVLGRRPTPLG